MPVLEKPQIREKSDGKEVHSRIIAELEKPLTKILEKIRNQDFDLIIGDDASGRIPTLILSEFFKAKAEKEGKELPKIIFIAGGTRTITNETRKKETVDKKKKEIGHFLDRQVKITNDSEVIPHVLVVTDTIDTGVTLQPLVETLKERGLNILVVTVGAMRGELTAEDFKNRYGVGVIYGIKGVHEIFSLHRLAGVRRSNESEIQAQPYKKAEKFSEEPAKNVQKTINLSREDAGTVAGRLIE